MNWNVSDMFRLSQLTKVIFFSRFFLMFIHFLDVYSYCDFSIGKLKIFFGKNVLHIWEIWSDAQRFWQWNNKNTQNQQLTWRTINKIEVLVTKNQ